MKNKIALAQSLIPVADELDEKGLINEAAEIDGFIKSLIHQAKIEDKMLKESQMSFDYNIKDLYKLIKISDVLDKKGYFKQSDKVMSLAMNKIAQVNPPASVGFEETKPARNSLLGPVADWWKARRRKQATDRDTKNLYKDWESHTEDLNALTNEDDYKDPRWQTLNRLYDNQDFNENKTFPIPYKEMGNHLPFSEEMRDIRNWGMSEGPLSDFSKEMRDQRFWRGREGKEYQRMKSVIDNKLRDVRNLPRRPGPVAKGQSPHADAFEDKLNQEMK